MKLIKISFLAILSTLLLLVTASCEKDTGVDNRDLDYGYVQFKLYKEASYSRAVVDQLDYLYDAKKIKVTLRDAQGSYITQTLVLGATNEVEAEWGLRSEKLRLLADTYTVASFTLYDALDGELYNGSTTNSELVITAGGLQKHDLTVDVTPRGSLLITFGKDLSQIETRAAADKAYTLQEVETADVTLRNKKTNAETTFSSLKVELVVDFDDDPTTEGYLTSQLICDSLLSLPAADYALKSYTTRNAQNFVLETNISPVATEFTIEDNQTTKAIVPITLHQDYPYIVDYIALKKIWEALDGENWSYRGDTYNKGINWNFNCDIDLWGAQPGVQLHPNGRVASIDLGDFGISGDMPAELGDLTELMELYLGTHNDLGMMPEDPADPRTMGLSAYTLNRFANSQRHLEMLYPAPQLSEYLALGAKIKGDSIREVALYDQYAADEILDDQGLPLLKPKDTASGSISNGLRSLPSTIGNLKKLTTLFMANGLIEELPAEMAELTALTDLEVYNCSKMVNFPMVIAQIPNLILINMSNNAQWSADQIYNGLDAICKAEGAKTTPTLQILYSGFNKLESVPASFNMLHKIGLVDLSYNKIHTIESHWADIAPVQLMLDHNELTALPRNSENVFCKIEDMETMSFSYNKFELIPNVFNSKSAYSIVSLNFSGNRLTGVEGGAAFKGINVKTLSITDNKTLTTLPVELATSESKIEFVNARACRLSSIDEKFFENKYSAYMVSFDLSYNHLDELPKTFNAEALPYLYGVDISYNRFDYVPSNPANSPGLTVYAIRGQRSAEGRRILKQWPDGIGQHKGLRAFFIGSNDLREIDDDISYLIYNLDIADNPNIVFDASDVCYYWAQGMYQLIYDKTQQILNCDAMLK